MRHDSQGGQYREQNVIIFTLWDWRFFSLVQAWEYSYSNNTVKEDIPNLNKQENEKLNFFSRLVLVNSERQSRKPKIMGSIPIHP